MTKPKTIKRTLWTVSEDGSLCSRTIRVPRLRPPPPKHRKGVHDAWCPGGTFGYGCVVGPNGKAPVHYNNCPCGADAENAQVRR